MGAQAQRAHLCRRRALLDRRVPPRADRAGRAGLSGAGGRAVRRRFHGYEHAPDRVGARAWGALAGGFQRRAVAGDSRTRTATAIRSADLVDTTRRDCAWAAVLLPSRIGARLRSGHAAWFAQGNQDPLMSF